MESNIMLKSFDLTFWNHQKLSLDPGLREFPRGWLTRKGDVTLLFDNFFPNNCLKMKKRLAWGRVPCHPHPPSPPPPPPQDPPITSYQIKVWGYLEYCSWAHPIHPHSPPCHRIQTAQRYNLHCCTGNRRTPPHHMIPPRYSYHL